MVATIMALAEKKLEKLNQRRRVTCPASDLVVGLQCGGSDAMSGVTANPAVGFAADLLVRAGATVMFSEVTEVRDAAHLLTARAATPEIAREFVREMAWYDEYLRAGRSGSSGESHAGKQAGRPGEHRREGDGVDCQGGQHGADGRGWAGRTGDAEGTGFCGNAGQRLYLRHAATGGGDEHAHFYDRAAARRTDWRWRR